MLLLIIMIYNYVDVINMIFDHGLEFAVLFELVVIAMFVFVIVTVVYY